MVIKSGDEIIHNHLGGFSFILNFDMTEVTTFLPLTDPFYDYFGRFLSFLRFDVLECESFRTFEIEHLNLERINDSFTVRTSPKVGMILFGPFNF